MFTPGQDLEQLVSRLSVDSLQEIVGQDIVSTVTVLDPPAGFVPALRQIARDVFHYRPDELFGSKNVRTICNQAMTTEKLDELVERLGLQDRRELESLDPLQDAQTWERYQGFFGIDTGSTASNRFEPDQQDVGPKFALFEHQRRAASRVYDALDGGYGRVVLHMPTGAGKTRTAMHVVSRVLGEAEPSVVVWLAASPELLDQAADAFEIAWSHLGNRSVKIRRCWGRHPPEFAELDDGLVIAGLQKMHSFSSRDPIGILRLASRVRLVVVDEAHQSIAPTYRSVISTLAETGQHNALLGLTATPGRTWSDIAADQELSEFFDERKVMLQVDGWSNPVSYLMDEGYLARPSFRQLDYEVDPGILGASRAAIGRFEDYGEDTLAALAASVERNVAVIDEIRRLVDSGHRRILLFAASVRHAEVIAAALCAIGLDGRVVTGESPLGARKRIIRAFRSQPRDPIVVCNYGVLTTGFDAPNTSAAVIARPTKSLVLYSNMVGRATRGPKVGGNETCEISTVVDIDLPGFRDVAEAFANWEDVWNEHSDS